MKMTATFTEVEIKEALAEFLKVKGWHVEGEVRLNVTAGYDGYNGSSPSHVSAEATIQSSDYLK